MDSIINEPVRGTIGDMSFLAVPGIDALRRAVRGEAPRPPIHHLTGITPTEVGLGKMTFKMPVTRWLEDAVGIIWGGVYAFFADAPISLALYSGLPAGKLLSTSELSINYLRPATRDSGHLIGRAQSVYLGREVGVSEATIEDQHGRTLAHATTRCVIQDFPVDPDIEPSVPEPPITDPPDPYLRTPPDDAWQDPAIFDTDKIPVMKKFIDGVISPGPVQLLTGSRFMSVEHGRVSISWPASPWFSAGGPAMYGGALAWACDTAIASAVWSTCDAGAVAATLDLQVRFLRPVMLDGSNLTVIGEIRHSGRTIRVAQAEVLDAAGKRVALATGSSLLIPGGIEQLKKGRRADEIISG
ncbi:MAG: hotdog fold thioesterase [Acidimicrobiia bacterium]